MREGNNAAKRVLRQSKRAREIPFDPSSYIPFEPIDDESPDFKAEKNEYFVRLQESLKVEVWKTFEMHFFQGLKLEEITARTGRPRATLYRYIAQAMALLKELMDRDR